MTLEQARKIDPTLNDDHTDEELQTVLDLLYGLTELAHEQWIKLPKTVAKIPEGSLPEQNEPPKI